MVARHRAQPFAAGGRPTLDMTALLPCRAPGPARHRILGADFRFHSDSDALLALVDHAYARQPDHCWGSAPPAIDIELCLDPRRSGVRGEPPPVRTGLDGRVAYGIMDRCNYVVVSPARRRARVVASADMLDRPYHLRYELIEFAVFLLAARCQGLVPLHAACIGRDGRGILVLGASGAGKSTLVLQALLRGLDLLSEDAVFVQPHSMRATGVGNFLHVHADALAGIGDPAIHDWIAASPVIRRRSGVEKFEADLREAPRRVPLAGAPMALVATVLLTPQASGRGSATLAPLPATEVTAHLAAGQAYAATQPGWAPFERAVAGTGVQVLRRGAHPGDSIDAIQRLLD
jgi:hypothetical protein